MKKNEVKGKTLSNIKKLYESFGYEKIFSRSDVMDVLAITPSPASVLINRMKIADIIKPVRGLGKGKYRFV